MSDTIGIIAGSGQFPYLVAQGARESGLRVVICGFEGNTEPDLAKEAEAFIMLHLGQLGALIDFFKKQGASRLCMAGAIAKPRALDIKPDFRAAKLLFRLAGNRGDDAILRAVAKEIQSEGIAVMRPEELVPELASPTGLISKRKPDAELWSDIRHGWHIAKQVGGLDIGQCVVVRGGIVMAVEAIEGTDAAIVRGAQLGGGGCTVVKVVKPGQDKRLDLPSIGMRTMELLCAHKCACLAYDATGTLFFDRKAALAFADEHNICVVALPADAEAFLA
ncbi:UDP-2,3-diacylglucosamine diphosphatase LpxI [Desulfovibrio sp. OttesenSCG-928-A18]|nr:UDP-2,3-diacylglucosamine diphosphatase LpxI [Desulfovibrio sp. OttesenSCG-928-A18]